MNNFNKLSSYGEKYNINNKLSFHALGNFKSPTIQAVLDFSYNMTFGNKGEHRDHRSGGIHSRRKGEIFANTFQGKLAECAIYNQLYKEVNITRPDFNTYELGIWDDADFTIEGHKVSIKSTKAFGNLLLLETKDWDKFGNYIPNNEHYDFTFLVRLKPYCEDILKTMHCLYSDSISYDSLRNSILVHNWEYDIPGYITLEDLQFIINNKFIIPQGSLLNGKTRMDAENYYVQSGDMKSIDKFIGELK